MCVHMYKLVAHVCACVHVCVHIHTFHVCIHGHCLYSCVQVYVSVFMCCSHVGALFMSVYCIPLFTHVYFHGHAHMCLSSCVCLFRACDLARVCTYVHVCVHSHTLREAHHIRSYKFTPRRVKLRWQIHPT